MDGFRPGDVHCAIDAKLRGCDLVRLRVSDVRPGGPLARGPVISRTGQPVQLQADADALAALQARAC